MTYQARQITPDLAGISLGAYGPEAAPIPQLMNLQVPPGTIINFSGTSAPYGYLVCPISATNISRTTYPDLFAAIGTTWGAGDGSSTFGMPWFAAGYAMTQANANVGTATTGANISHNHVENYDSSTGGLSSNPLGLTNNLNSVSPTSSASALSTGSSGGAANLAASAAILMCVKY